MLVAVLFGGMAGGLAAPPASAPDMPPPKSVFTMPAKPSEGRDPFFPDSIRPYEAAQAAAAPSNVPSITDLVVKTILVNGHGRAFAVINDQTFGVGDEGDVLTRSGRRIHIQCTGINAARGTVTVEVGEAMMTLTYTSDP